MCGLETPPCLHHSVKCLCCTNLWRISLETAANQFRSLIIQLYIWIFFQVVITRPTTLRMILGVLYSGIMKRGWRLWWIVAKVTGLVIGGESNMANSINIGIICIQLAAWSAARADPEEYAEASSRFAGEAHKAWSYICQSWPRLVHTARFMPTWVSRTACWTAGGSLPTLAKVNNL